MFDVICIGGATQDIFFIDPAFPVKDNQLVLDWGEKFLSQDCLITCGGGAANSSVGLARLGFKTAFWGQLGLDIPGETVAQNFKTENVSLKFLKISKATKTSISAVLVGLGGEHTIVMYRGQNDDLEDEVTSLETDLAETKYFYLADVGSTSEKLTGEVLRLVKKHGIKLVFVPGQNQLKQGLSKLAGVLQQTELFVLNLYEAHELLGWPYEKQNLNAYGAITKKVEEALVHFNKLGAKNVVITRDVCGSQAYDGSQFYAEAAPVIKERVDTTGAGDAFATGVLAAMLRGKDLGTGLKWGNLESGSVLQTFGAQPGLLKVLTTDTKSIS